MLSENILEKRLQIAGIVLILGLLAEGLCLLGRGPVAFLLFVGLAGLLLVVGILIFLLALVRAGHVKSQTTE
jgi:uncharacterized membrane protein